LGTNDGATPFADRHHGDSHGPVGRHDHAAPRNLHAKKRKRGSPHRHGSDPLRAAYERAKHEGWLPYFREAATAEHFSPELLLAIAYRESGLNPRYLRVAGDNGHGHGLMQIDDRSFKAWTDAGHWKNARDGILKGAEVLASHRDSVKALSGKSFNVTTHDGHTYSAVGKAMNDEELLAVTVAAYNSGLWAYYHFSKGHDVDQGTTGKNYSKDVLGHVSRFRTLLNADKGEVKHPPGRPHPENPVQALP
jgi:hypothetical protein